MKLTTFFTTVATMLAALALIAPGASADTPGELIVTDTFGPSPPGTGSGSVIKVSPAGVPVTIAANGLLTEPEGIVRLGSDDYLVANRNFAAAGSLIRITNGVQAAFTVGGLLDDPHALALSRDRKFAYVGQRDPTGPAFGNIVEVDLKTGAQRLVSTGGLVSDTRGLAVGPKGQLYAVSNEPSGLLVEVNLASGAQTALVSTPLIGPRSITARPNGDLIIGDHNGPGDGVIYNVDLPSAAVSAIAGGPVFGGASIPSGLALETDGSIIVADRNHPANNANGRLIRVTNGVPTVLIAETSNLISEGAAVVVVPPKCAGRSATIVGSPGKDQLRGTDAADVIVGLDGKDTIKGLKGKDRLCGGKGKDKIVGGKGNDKIVGGKGSDTEIQ